eukprot:gene17391-34922_t
MPASTSTTIFCNWVSPRGRCRSGRMPGSGKRCKRHTCTVAGCSEGKPSDDEFCEKHTMLLSFDKMSREELLVSAKKLFLANRRLTEETA